MLAHLRYWGDEHYSDPAGAPLVVEHTGCGGHQDEHLLCDRCGTPLTPENTTSLPGPAYANQS